MPELADKLLELMWAQVEAELEQARAWAKAWKRAAKRARAINGQSVCVYCGHVGKRNGEEMLAHVKECAAHPLGVALRELERIEQENARMRSVLSVLCPPDCPGKCLDPAGECSADTHYVIV